MFLEDIQLAMSRIAEYIKGYDFEDFQQDHKTADAVIRNFQKIGEASKNLDPSIKEKYPILPW